MGKYSGPREKICRKLGQILPGLTTSEVMKRPYPPGEHGQTRKKISDYGKRLMEKQIVRYHYGVREKQLRRVYEMAKISKGVTGDVLLATLEKRLDNVVWRAGFTKTIPAARQLVGHGHIFVDGKKVDIPSYIVKTGQVISIREKSKKLAQIENCILAKRYESAPKFLEVDTEATSAKIVSEPQKEDVPLEVDVQLIVEYYSK